MRAVFFAGAVLVSLGALSSCSKTNDIDQSSSDGAKIGKGGGIVPLDLDDDGVNEAELRIPGGALSEEHGFNIAVAEPSEYPPQDTTYEFATPVYAITPHGLSFLSPATISLLNPNSATTMLRAEENGAWQPITSQPYGDRLEATVTGLSYFALANVGSTNSGGASCSGRGPNGSSPTGTVSGLSGILAAGLLASDHPDVDLSTLIDGYAALDQNGTNLNLVFLPYTEACGYQVNGVTKNGAFGLNISVGSANPITTQTYDPASVQAGVWGVPQTGPMGECAGPNPLGSGASACPAPCTPGVTITALDATHVAGSFDFVPTDGATELIGTFDLPICAPAEGLNPAICCMP